MTENELRETFPIGSRWTAKNDDVGDDVYVVAIDLVNVSEPVVVRTPVSLYTPGFGHSIRYDSYSPSYLLANCERVYEDGTSTGEATP